jgi:hypothetical protein
MLSADESKRSEHQDADARAEVAPIKRYGKLKQDRAKYGVWVSGLCFQVGEAPHNALAHKQDGGEENKERHEFVEGSFACSV